MKPTPEQRALTAVRSATTRANNLGREVFDLAEPYIPLPGLYYKGHAQVNGGHISGLTTYAGTSAEGVSFISVCVSETGHVLMTVHFKKGGLGYLDGSGPDFPSAMVKLTEAITEAGETINGLLSPDSPQEAPCDAS